MLLQADEFRLKHLQRKRIFSESSPHSIGLGGITALLERPTSPKMSWGKDTIDTKSRRDDHGQPIVTSLCAYRIAATLVQRSLEDIMSRFVILLCLLIALWVSCGDHRAFFHFDSRAG